VRIVHFIKWLRLRDGGTVRAVLDLCEALARRGHEVTALSCDDSGVPESWRGPRRPGVPRSVVIRLADPLFERGGRTVANAIRDTITQYLPGEAIRAARDVLAEADILHLHGVWANCNHQLARLAERSGRPFVVSPHGMLDDWSMSQGAAKKRLHLSLMGRRTLERARAVHCTARAELDQAAKHFPRGRGVVIPLLFDLAQFGTLPGTGPALAAFPALAADMPRVLFLSRLHAKKGVEILIRALSASARLNAPFTLLLAGPSDPPDYIESLRALAREESVAEHVHFLGMVTGRDKLSLYQAADVFALPTSQENFGYVLYESLACGTPVVTTRGVDTWTELVASGGATIVDREERAVRSAIRAVIDDPEKRRAMGESGRAWALTHLDREATIDAYEAAYAGRP
jgi:glycosyltransferase involved in cell wall biosynthesis